jgi:hypothetical protein
LLHVFSRWMVGEKMICPNRSNPTRTASNGSAFFPVSDVDWSG